jgi:phage-related protein
MRFFANNKCRAVILCGTLFAFGGTTQNLNAREAQAQGSSQSDIALFDAFLDAHADIDAQLRGNPSLLTNAEYLEAHPQLEAFLNQHPQAQTQIGQNPSFFMEREKRFDRRESRQRANPNPDLTRQEVSRMDQFLDKNPNIDQDLRRNPGLVNNAEYLEAHPQLQAFLNQHPNVKEEITENPRYFMQREKRFDAQEARQGSNPNPDLTRQQVAVLDQFLDSHPDIDRTLDKNPWLIRNAQYLKEHPELQTFLNQHPELKEESAETPAYLMEREKRFDAREAGRGRDRDFDRDRDRDASRGRDVDRRANPNPDLTNREVATVDNFLDRHKDIAKSLEKKPELVNDHGYLKHHKDLDEFLSEHPAVREELRENPSYFMHRETQFEARNMDRDVPDRDRDRVRDRDRDRDPRDVDNDLNKKELQDMDRFLDKHKNIDKDLQKNPSLVNDRDYLKHHKQLEAFLSKNPQVGEELRENPTRFMQKQEQLEARSHRMNNRQPATKPKTKVEQKEEMHSATPH